MGIWKYMLTVCPLASGHNKVPLVQQDSFYHNLGSLFNSDWYLVKLIGIKIQSISLHFVKAVAYIKRGKVNSFLSY